MDVRARVCVCVCVLVCCVVSVLYVSVRCEDTTVKRRWLRGSLGQHVVDYVVDGALQAAQEEPAFQGGFLQWEGAIDCSDLFINRVEHPGGLLSSESRVLPLMQIVLRPVISVNCLSSRQTSSSSTDPCL